MRDPGLVAAPSVDPATVHVTFEYLAWATLWLLVATGIGLIASIKLHWPEFLPFAWLSFGRVRAHRALPARVLSHVRLREDSKAGHDIVSFDVTFAADFMHGNDVGMLKVRGGPGLVEKPVGLALRQLFASGNLDGDDAA